MGKLKSVSMGMLLFAITLGVIGKVKPEVFLKIPGIGFLPYAILGGKPIPPYFDNEPFLGGNFREWVHDGDVMIATGAKSGTTWMCYCTHAIRNKGLELPERPKNAGTIGHPYTDIMYTTPWMEMHQKPGQGWAERKVLYNTTVLPDGTRLKDYWDNPSYPFRVFKSHFAPDDAVGGDPFQNVLPVRKYPKVRYVVSMRNGLEVAMSLWSFFAKHSPSFQSMWGGFPPVYADSSSVVKDLLPGGNIYGLYFGYVKAWWPYRNDPNVLLLHYAEMTKDTGALVTKLAAFLGVELTWAEHAKVTEMCSFKHMKEHSDYFNYRLPTAPDAGFPSVFSGDFVNKGQTGAGAQTQLSPELQKQWDDTLKAEFSDPTLLRWANEGGSW